MAHKPKVLIDTDVLLDVAFDRTAWVADSQAVLRWCQASGTGALAPHSLANCAYLLKSTARPFLKTLLIFLEVAPLATSQARQALALPVADLEDALQVGAGIAWGADLILTRNLPDYRRSPIPALSPSAFLAQHGNLP